MRLTLVILCAAALQLSAETPLAERVDAYLAPLVESQTFSGVVLIAKGDKPLVQRTYGKASYDLNVPMSTGARFRIASITKTFTSAAILMLIDRGKVGLDDPLAKYIPSFPNADKITIRHLLLHASGVPNPDSPPCSEATLDDLVAELAKKPLWFEPGKGSGYSNGGYALLARVIETASGMKWEEFLRKELFTPAGLNSTMRDAERPIVAGRVDGYIPAPGPTGVANAPCQNAGAAIGSGALLSTAADLHRWGQAAVKQTLFKLKGLEWPYGWGARTYHERPAVEQSGILNGFASYLAFYPEDDLYVVMLSNIQSGALTHAGIGLAGLVLGKDVKPLPRLASPIPSTAALRKPWVGRWNGPEYGFTISERDGELYQTFADAKLGSFVFLTGPASAVNRQDGIPLALDGDVIRFTFGDQQVEFKRVK